MVNHLPRCSCLSGPQRRAWGRPRCQRMWLRVRRNVECGLTTELEIASGLVTRSETLTHSPANHSAWLKTFIFFNCIKGKVHKHPSGRNVNTEPHLMNDCVLSGSNELDFWKKKNGSETLCEPAESECDLQQQPQTGSAAGSRFLKEHRNWNDTRAVVIF